MFSRLERDMVHDLSAWRHEVIDLFYSSYETALQIELERSNGKSLLSDPASIQAIKFNLMSFIAQEWDDLEDVPQPGEYMQIGGPVWWYDANDTGDSPTPHLLLDERHIYGNYVDWKILPYIDDKPPHPQQESYPVLNAQTYPFGIHLVIEDPTFTDKNNNVIEIYRDEICVPVHYDRARFVVYGNY